MRRAEVLEQARWWCWRRQRLDRTSHDVMDALRSVIGVYSSNPHGPLSLLARVPRLMKGAAVEGVVSTKLAVRIPAMRRSIYLVPEENAHRIFWATRNDAAQTRARRRAGVDDDAYKRLRRAVIAATQRPVTADAIAAAIEDAPEDLMPVIDSMCAEGDLLRIKSTSIRADALTYAATMAWLEHKIAKTDPDDALAWLAGEYLRAFGPATVEDFTWWAGMPPAACAEAIERCDATDAGSGLLLLTRDVRPFEQMRPHTGRVNLLPKWDCYTMGYAEPSRRRFASPAALKNMYDRGGNARAVVLVDATVAGEWDMRFRGDKASVRFRLSKRPSALVRELLETEARMAAAFLEAREVAVTFGG